MKDKEDIMKRIKNLENYLEITMLISFFAGVCAAEDFFVLIGCWAVCFGAYLIYRRVC